MFALSSKSLGRDVGGGREGLGSRLYGEVETGVGVGGSLYVAQASLQLTTLLPRFPKYLLTIGRFLKIYFLFNYVYMHGRGECGYVIWVLWDSNPGAHP